MATSKLAHPGFTKTPFGGVQTKGKPTGNAELPSKHALAALVKSNPAQQSPLEFARLTPLGSGAPDADYASMVKKGPW